MKTSRFTDSQIIAILKQAEAGSPIPELCREHDEQSALLGIWPLNPVSAQREGVRVESQARLLDLPRA